ncbi:hypothetical protein POTOM_033071 [Populus tomentosa]|uniref:Uncharacterized protein n=1 Tax=Populus tomentosa TaxID=118781 RepID=A0A8X8CQL1_POPTO|nr:hypothetical protein POTOM_033071 [Populus tomentosa]
MDSSSKELLHLAHKSSSTTSSNAVLYLRFRGVWQWTMMVLSSEQCFCPPCPESETIDDHVIHRTMILKCSLEMIHQSLKCWWDIEESKVVAGMVLGNHAFEKHKTS